MLEELERAVVVGFSATDSPCELVKRDGNSCEVTCMLEDSLLCKLVEATGEANMMDDEILIVEGAISTCMLDGDNCEPVEVVAENAEETNIMVEEESCEVVENGIT